MVPHKGGVGQSEIDIPPKMDGSDWKRSKKWTHGVLPNRLYRLTISVFHSSLGEHLLTKSTYYST